jgi:glycine/D-amino acid oxidase-like deaminating enzyme
VLILLTIPLDVPATVGSRNISYRPDLDAACPDSIADVLSTDPPDVLITRSAVTPNALAAWRAARPDAPLIVASVGMPPSAETGPESADNGFSRHHIIHRRANDTIEALKIAERTWNDAVSEAPPTRRSADRSVTLVGGGIVNLVTALYLLRNGYQVTLYDKAPDPRANADWTKYGCTRGGGDGRMFTLTEADSYNGRARRSDQTSNDLLTLSVSNDGWRVSKPGDPLDVERQWAERFHQMPPWLAESYNDDIFAVNQAAMPQWADLMQSNPALFDKSTGYQKGILRLYMENDYFERHVLRNNSVGATRRILNISQIRDHYPALAEACDNGTVVGGIEVVGFTVNIHKFVAQLVSMLESEGIQFHWNTLATGIRWTELGIAGGIETEAGLVQSHHYVLSPGAYGDDLLRGTATYGKIQGMLGAWLTIPNIEPQLTNSVKIARSGHRAEETNVTVATDEGGNPTLVCGSGYGWTGLDPQNIDSAELDTLFDGLDDTLRRFFPTAHEAARTTGTFHGSRQLCVRPWTASCLGIFERIGATDGGMLIVTGGHNTGGFTQSPVVAEAVVAAFEGQRHTMHSRYDPRRLEQFYSAGLTPTAP